MTTMMMRTTFLLLSLWRVVNGAGEDILIRGYVTDGSVVPEDCTPEITSSISAAYQYCIDKGSNHQIVDAILGWAKNGNNGNGSGSNRMLTSNNNDNTNEEVQQQEQLEATQRELRDSCPSDCQDPSDPSWCPNGLGFEGYCQPCQNFESACASSWYQVSNKNWDSDNVCSICTNSKGRRGLGESVAKRRLTTLENDIAAECSSYMITFVSTLNSHFNNYCHGDASTLTLSVLIDENM